MSKSVPGYILPETDECSDTGDVRVISSADVLCGSLALQQNFQLFVAQRRTLCREFSISLELPDGHSLLLAVTPVPLNH